LTSRELARKFPIQYLGTLGNRRPGYFGDMNDKPLPDAIRAGTGNVSVNVNDLGELTLTGKDRRGKAWKAILGNFPTLYACRFYVGDLDKNGLRDIVLVFPTGGNGLAPTSTFLAISFDIAGRPVAFEADGYWELNDSAIFDLLDMDKNGRAELVYMNFDDGYWITNVYEIANARWQKVRRLAGRNYPIYTRFTYRPNKKPTVPKPTRHPYVPDLSNSLPVVQGHLTSYKWANVEQSEDILLGIKSKFGITSYCKPVSWYASFSLAIDGEEGRTIVFLSANEKEIKSALDTIVSGKYLVFVFGKRRAKECSPELLWAQSD
jgi:hypothetical protein